MLGCIYKLHPISCLVWFQNVTFSPPIKNLVLLQDALAAAHPSNSLLQVRGNAGTHDLALGLRTIRSLKYGVEQTSSSLSSSSSSAVRDTGSSFRIPRYDKSARGGRGDRAPEEQWSAVPVMPEIVILEGWMLGFEALPEGSPLLDYDGEYDNKANQGECKT